MAECIVLKGGSGADLDVITAGAGDVLAGKVIVGPDGEPLTGIMPNRGAVNQSLGINGTYTIPAGYHNGSGKVTQNITTMAGQTITPGNSQQTISCSGKYMTGDIVINGVRAYAWLSTQKATVGSRSFTNTDGNTYTLPYLSFAPGFTPIMYNAIISNGYVTSVSTPWENVFVGAGVYDNKGFYSRASAPATASSLVIPVLNSGIYNVWIAGYY